jgi:hypothetical protein
MDLIHKAIDLLPKEEQAEARTLYETLRQNVIKNHHVVTELCWQRNFFADRAAQKAFEKD